MPGTLASEFPNTGGSTNPGSSTGASSLETRLADGRYERVLIETVEDGILQGYSALLNLFIRW